MQKKKKKNRVKIYKKGFRNNSGNRKKLIATTLLFS